MAVTGGQIMDPTEAASLKDATAAIAWCPLGGDTFGHGHQCSGDRMARHSLEHFRGQHLVVLAPMEVRLRQLSTLLVHGM